MHDIQDMSRENKRIFAIKDESLPQDRILGYLVYYETAKAFYVELPDDADEWETPLLLSSFVKKGEHSIGGYWSRLWVEQRAVPPDRQNIGQILKENNLSEYDTFSMLMISMGRCEQDSCFLEEIDETMLPGFVKLRWQNKVEDVVPLENKRLLVFFRNGNVKVVDMKDLKLQSVDAYISVPERFEKVEVQPDGYGVMWSEKAVIPDNVLFVKGKSVPISLEDFCSFVRLRVINSSQAAEILNCSRQNIDDLIRRNKLHPIREDAKSKLFLKNEIVQRKKAQP